MKWLMLLIIFGWIPMVNGEIINGHMETDCSSGSCIATIYSGETFMKQNDIWRSYEEFTNFSTENFNINYTAIDGTNFYLKPMVNYNNVNYNLSELPTNIKTNINFNNELLQSRHFNKFLSKFTRINGLAKVGFKVISNKKVFYNDHGFVVGNISFSYEDLLGSGFSVTRNKDEIWVTLNPLGNTQVVLDPISSYNITNESEDGNWRFNEAGGCNVVNNATTGTIGENFAGAPSDILNYGYLPFNTTDLENSTGNTITKVTIGYYAQTYVRTVGQTDVWEVAYLYNTTNLGQMDCLDFNKFPNTYFMKYNASGTPATWINHTFENFSTGYSLNNVVNVTGISNYRIDFIWETDVIEFDTKYITFRTSENAIASTRPIMQITYTPPVTTKMFFGKSKKTINRLYPIPLFIVLFIITMKRRKEDD